MPVAKHKRFEYFRNYREKNAVKLKQKKKEWYIKNKERLFRQILKQPINNENSNTSHLSP